MRAWQPTPVFLPGKFLEQRSLVGYSPLGCKELDPTERLHIHIFTRDYYSVIKRNEIESAIVMQMNLKYGMTDAT